MTLASAEIGIVPLFWSYETKRTKFFPTDLMVCVALVLSLEHQHLISKDHGGKIVQLAETFSCL